MRQINEEEKDIIFKYRNKSAINALVLSMVFMVIGFFLKYFVYTHSTSGYLKLTLLLIIGIILFVQNLIILMRTNSTVNKLEVETVQILDISSSDKKKLNARIVMHTTNGPEQKTVEIIPGEETFISKTGYGNLCYIKDKPYYILRASNQYYY